MQLPRLAQKPHSHHTRGMHRLLCALLLAPPVVSAQTRSPGDTVHGRNRYVEYRVGSLPIVLSAPHGGREKPDELPDRTRGTFSFDTNTQELARAIGQAFVERTGQHPHLVICTVHRRKVDCNREIAEGAAGHPLTEQLWHEFQNFIGDARRTVLAQHGRGFYIDLHGHGHPVPRLELGYAHSTDELGLPATQLASPNLIQKGSLHLFALKKPHEYADLLHGPMSFGGLMEKAGYPSTPSPANPTPGELYFNGGYNLRTHTAPGTGLAGLQIESNSKGVRDTEASRKKFASALVEQLSAYLEIHMDLRIPLKAR